MNMYDIYLDDISEESIKFQAWLKKNGANYEFTKELILASDYNAYIALISDKVIDKDTEEYYYELLNLDYSAYVEFKQSCIDMINTYIETKDNKEESVPKFIPYHKILNGNFDKIVFFLLKWYLLF